MAPMITGPVEMPMLHLLLAIAKSETTCLDLKFQGLFSCCQWSNNVIMPLTTGLLKESASA